MKLFLEYGYTSFNKFGEELCGDKVSIISKDGYTTLVLADGLGSGVKANILSTLTSKILSTMVSNNISIKECVETIIETLPVCKDRGVAYSTFSVIHLNSDGIGYMFEFDNPQCIFFRDCKAQELEREEINILGKKVYKSYLKLKNQDKVIVMSDGVPHAGIGKIMNLGWQRNDIINYIEENIDSHMSATCVANMLASASKALYLNEPGDDTTVAVIKIREEQNVNIMIGPPVKKEDCDKYVRDFLNIPGIRIVCGGTTSQIVANYLNEEVTTTFSYEVSDIPPIGYINGIDLTTEGVLTLRKLIELSETYIKIDSDVPKKFIKKDGASQIANFLFEEATNINFFVGQAVNEAHTGSPIDSTLKFKLVEKLSENLISMGKKIDIKYY